MVGGLIVVVLLVVVVVVIAVFIIVNNKKKKSKSTHVLMQCFTLLIGMIKVTPQPAPSEKTKS